jgi:hypothetical protein
MIELILRFNGNTTPTLHTLEGQMAGWCTAYEGQINPQGGDRVSMNFFLASGFVRAIAQTPTTSPTGKVPLVHVETGIATHRAMDV